ncbi:MAG: hypothetical protein WBR29_10935 [Gammaproteobacteria bacterium]
MPVLLVSQEFIAKAIIRANTGRMITGLFLSGVGLQILATFLYKYSMEYLYFSELDFGLKETIRLKIAIWLSNAIWFEILLDLLSMALFVLGTFMVVAAVLAPA